MVNYVKYPTTVRQQQVWAAAQQQTHMRITCIAYVGRGVWDVTHCAESMWSDNGFKMTKAEIDAACEQEVAPAQHASIDSWSTYTGD